VSIIRREETAASHTSTTTRGQPIVLSEPQPSRLAVERLEH
jgi:hypothetical protein